MKENPMGGVVLVVDDERRVRESVRAILEDEGYSVLEADDGESALNRVAEDRPDAVLLDVWMPGIDGIETLKGIKQQDQDLPVVIMSGHGNIETAVNATKLGAFDFLEKPLSLDRLNLVLRNALSQRELVEENRALRDSHKHEGSLVGHSEAMKEILSQVKIVAPTHASVLITGENGTGKEILAREVHALSQRSQRPFVAVNCAAIPDNLIESELFGYERGAFTGATTRKKGRFDLAHRGTLLLDEIGDMSLATQAKILRVLEDQVFQRVGGNRDIEVNVRIIAATNKNLAREIEEGRFREDLFFRLNVFPFHIPPIRERKEDIAPLLMTFVEEFGNSYSKPELVFSNDAVQILTAYSWPGNIRELRNVVERMIILSTGLIVDADLVPDSIRQGKPAAVPMGMDTNDVDYRKAKETFEREFFSRCLEKNRWNVSKTSAEVGLERSNLHRKIKQLGLINPEKGS